jgi:Fur family transcriptional regulator, ferric uptake regulator
MSAPVQRHTKQRAAVLKLLNELDEFSSAQDIHARLRTNGSSVGLTTVYRTLQSLERANEVDVIRTDDGEARYRRCTLEHHHHIVCRRCGRTIEVDSPDVETWAALVAKEHGFAEITHTLEIYGVCSACTDSPSH